MMLHFSKKVETTYISSGSGFAAEKPVDRFLRDFQLAVGGYDVTEYAFFDKSTDLSIIAA
jgi:hypothetical protein